MYLSCINMVEEEQIWENRQSKLSFLQIWPVSTLLLFYYKPSPIVITTTKTGTGSSFL